MRLSVLIVNYNVKAFLDQCLRSVRAASVGLEVEVIVVDNASSDGSEEWIRSQFPEVHWIASPTNLGFGRANNLALKQSSGEFVLFLNPDTVVPEDNFSAALDYLTGHPQVGSLGCRMIDGTGAFLPESKRGIPSPLVALYRLVGLSSLLPKSPRWARYYLGHLPEDQNNEVDVHCGAWMMARKSVLNDLGGFDEDFFMYGEDIDLSFRIQKAGWQNHYLATSPIIHYKGESTKHATWKHVKNFHEAMAIFARKHFAKQAALFTALISFGIYAKASSTLIRRWGGMVLPFILDGLLGYFFAEAITGYWERSHRYIDGGTYPTAYRLYVLPAYGLTWFAVYYAMGGAHKSLRRYFSGGLLATLTLLVGYALLPVGWRFSRALILLSALMFAAAAMLSRLARFALGLRHLGILRSGTVHFGRPKPLRTPMEESLEFDLPMGPRVEAALATFRPALISIHPGSGITYRDSIALMIAQRGQGLRYRMVYPEWILGSDHRGLASGAAVPELDKPVVRRSRQALHLGITVFLVLASPILLLFSQGRLLLREVPEVVLGRKSWVGYAGDGLGLSPLKPGVVSHVPTSGQAEWDREADRRYAYRWQADIDVFALLRRRPLT